MLLDIIVMLIGYLAPLVSTAAGFLGTSLNVVTTFGSLMGYVLNWIMFIMTL